MTSPAKLSLFLAIALLAGCRDHDRDDADENAATPAADTTAADSMAADNTTPPADNTASTMPAETPMAPDATSTAPTAADALPLVMAIDQHEIDAAQLAKTKATRSDVKAYAAMLEKDHRDNLTQAQALPGATPAPATDSGAVADQKRKGQESLDSLRATDGAAFDAAYLDAMVSGHTDALSTLDNTLIPGATDDKVRDFLGKTREAVQKHLDKAKALQAK
jgi:putative membrane protein